MVITDLPLFSMLRTRMHWHQERQRVLAENVSNAKHRSSGRAIWRRRNWNPGGTLQGGCRGHRPHHEAQTGGDAELGR